MGCAHLLLVQRFTSPDLRGGEGQLLEFAFNLYPQSRQQLRRALSSPR
ncbi:hypothetical protein [Burkholderia ubonensis]|nr:hypothetical protein [Burkholderia ubonensis]